MISAQNLRVPFVTAPGAGSPSARRVGRVSAGHLSSTTRWPRRNAALGRTRPVVASVIDPPAVPIRPVAPRPPGMPGTATPGPILPKRAPVVAKPGIHGAPQPGLPEPFGATATPTGANFAIFSSNATGVSLVLFTNESREKPGGEPVAEIPLDPAVNKTGSVWHVLVPDLNPDLQYGFRLAGPNEAHMGQRFKADKVVIDPYAKAVITRPEFGVPCPDGETWPQMASPVPLPYGQEPEFDWEGVESPNRPLDDLVIYEMHVRGFTRDPSSGGTYAGLIEKLPHIKKMGFNAIELLPIHEFNEVEYWSPTPTAYGGTRCNFWGYSTVNYFSPMARYASNPMDGRAVNNEVKEMVKACHAAGVEVILDVVFNHTAEGNEQGPTISFRGVDNRVYYMLAPEGQFYNYSGCGNTVNCNHPVVRQFIVDCLRYWVTEYHIDGFRFDLASIMTRAPSHWENGKPIANNENDPNAIVTGHPLAEPPLIDMISNDGILRSVKLIAEAWDAGGLYQVGTFPHWGIWAEWNGKFRDTIRNFIKGTDGFAGEFAERICGSPQLYATSGRAPRHSINFVTAHDGFTMMDAVSYNKKHNEANGENNRDGEEHNLSWNCGAENKDEGPSSDPGVIELRARQIRNMMSALVLSLGVPMFTMGDEYGHTKGGNNNTYCHDAPLNWFDWAQAEADPDGLMRFCSKLIHLRHSTPALRLRTHPSGAQIDWHGTQPKQPDWSEGSRFVAYTLTDQGSLPIFVGFNASHLPQYTTLPDPGRGNMWTLVMDTALPAPFDFPGDDLPEDIRYAAEAQLKTLKLNFYPISDRSVVVLKVVPIPQGMPGSIPPPPPPPPVMPVMPGPPPPAAGAPGF